MSGTNNWDQLKSLRSSKLRVFGEKCVVTLPPYTDKLDTRASVGIYLGYDHSTYGHSVFIPKVEGDLTSGFHEYTRHVRFLPTSKLYADSCTEHGDIDIPSTDFSYDIDMMDVDASDTDEDIVLTDATDLLVDNEVSDDEVMDDAGEYMHDSITIELQQHDQYVGDTGNTLYCNL
ncbi:unnamed protein product [Ambrosiozyma monospora]|uniref:Unnamed protein product n=1 Tax=Ambrosiozyma monospora TaxID=43982 RepID=A0A9W7DJD1_AMBMO|nr:unnamed protein product [Ambrosiozyma monospora]